MTKLAILVILIIATISACAQDNSGPWEQTGDWERNEFEEEGFAVFLQKNDVSAPGGIKFASLDSPQISPQRDLFLTLGCVDGIQVIYIASYTDKLYGSSARYVIQAKNVETRSRASGIGFPEPSGSSSSYRLAITDQEQINNIMEVLSVAHTNETHTDLDVKSMNRSLMSSLDPRGMDDALEYLGCFN